MRNKRHGSAAVAREATPESAVHEAVLRCIARLNDATELAAAAVTGPEPERAARLLGAAVKAVQAELRRIPQARRSS